jgi:hypothetical protein
MNLHSRHVRRDCPASLPTPGHVCSAAINNTRTKIADCVNDNRGTHTRPRELVLATTASSVTAGALYWHSTRSLIMSLGVVLIVALVGIVAAWLYAREETRRVQAREQGASEREWIRFYAEIRLAEAQKSLIEATTCGPCSTPGEAEAVRLDARKVLELFAATTVKDAMRITRTQDVIDKHTTAPGRGLEPSP